jgi:hypothetical protein
MTSVEVSEICKSESSVYHIGRLEAKNLLDNFLDVRF